MAIDVQTFAAAKGYTDQSLAGGGVIKGKNCVISSIREITGGHRVTYQWTLDNGTVQQDTVDVMDGAQGPQGVKGDTGNTGATGATGPAGANGQAATIQVGTVTSGESAGVTNSGTSQNAVFNFTLPKGDKGDKGDKGADGENGSSFSIRARFSTEEELIAAYPDGPENPGDAYFVGTTASPDLYVWLIDAEEWHNNGPIAGVKGDKGDTGDDGFSPVAQVTKSGSITTISIRDKTGSTSVTVSDGADGQDGSDGNDGKSAYEVAVDEGFVGTESEWLASLKGDPGANGTNGQNGADGVSPVANVTKNGSAIKIHIEDVNGTTEETIDMSSYASASDVSAIEGKIPSNASASNKLVTASDNNFTFTVLPSPTDFNTVKTPGVYTFGVSEKNPYHAPLVGTFTLIVSCQNADWVQQLAIFNGDGRTFVRISSSGNWSDWEQLVTENEAILRHDISIPVASGTTFNNPFDALQYQLIHTDWTFLTSSDWHTASGGYELQGYHWGAYTATHTTGNNVIVTGTITWDAKSHTFSAYYDVAVLAWKVTINGEELIYNADNITVTKDTSTGRRVFVRSTGDTNVNALYNALGSCDLLNRPSTGIFNWTLQQNRTCEVGAPYNTTHWTTPLEAGNLYYMQNPRVSAVDDASASWWVYWNDGNVYTACNMWGENSSLCTYVALEYII